MATNFKGSSHERMERKPLSKGCRTTSWNLRHPRSASSLENLDAFARGRCCPSWLAESIPAASEHISINAKKVNVCNCRWLSVVGRQLRRATLKAAKEEFGVVSVCTEGPQWLGKRSRRKCFKRDILGAAYEQHPSSSWAWDTLSAAWESCWAPSIQSEFGARRQGQRALYVWSCLSESSWNWVGRLNPLEYI